MPGNAAAFAEKNKINFACGWADRVYCPRVSKTTILPLEDELGDVLEKAMRREGLTVEKLSGAAGVPLARICDALDYRGDLTNAEIGRLAAVLRLNEVGLCALGSGQYPLPEAGVLPFCVWPLRMPHGIGVANAYLMGECGSSRAVLFDTGGGMAELAAVWPESIRELDAVFLTHVEPEHAGGLCDVVKRFGVVEALVPEGAVAPCGRGMADGQSRQFGRIKVTAFATPGHAAAHNCYLVTSTSACDATPVLISGDLIFAGSVGGAFFSAEQLRLSLRRMLAAVPPKTVIAPGHGPLTTVGNELRYNPFVA
jgi:glyoxylase-like metal-dependent hydrolase (beta-lactamase superfamily II)